MKPAIRGLIALIVVLLAWLPATAQGRWYVGLGTGDADFGLGLGAFDDGSISQPVIDDSSTGWKGYAGYRLSGGFAIEAGFLDLGDASFSGMSDGGGLVYAAGPVAQKIEVDGPYAALVATLYATRSFTVHGKYGYLKWDQRITSVDSAGARGASFDDTESFYGAGLDLTLTRRFSVRGEFEKFQDVGRDDVELISFGLIYRLGGR